MHALIELCALKMLNRGNCKLHVVCANAQVYVQVTMDHYGLRNSAMRWPCAVRSCTGMRNTIVEWYMF